jgi:hypothetical protein
MLVKKVIDIHLHKKELHNQFENNKKGFKLMISCVKKSTNTSKENIMVALAYKGLYSYNLSVFLANNEFKYITPKGL